MPFLAKKEKNMNFNDIHTRQLDQSDCGVACLRSILRYFESDASPEQIRELSGTSSNGTTLLGLQHAAKSLGLEAEGYEANIQSLQKCSDPCILHVIKEGRLQHYINYYGYDHQADTFLIGDPAELKISPWPKTRLEAIWSSKCLLRCTPTPHLKKNQATNRQKRQWIWRLIQEDISILGIALAIGIGVAMLGLATAIFSQQLIDYILPAGDVWRLYAGSGLLCFLLLARGGLMYLRQLLLLRQSRDFNLRIINHFYGSLLELPKPFFDNRQTGDLVARMNDTQRIQRAISQLAGSALIDVLLALTASTAIFIYDWQTGLIIVFWIPAFIFVAQHFHLPILDGQRAVMEAYARNESNYVDTIQGIGEIKVNNKQTVFSKLTQDLYSRFQQAILDLGKTGIRFSFYTEILSAAFIVVVITWSGVEVLAERLSTGALIAILQIVSLLMGAVQRLAITNIQLQEARVAFERMFEFTKMESEFESKSEKAKAHISGLFELRMEKLAFRFPGRPKLLSDVSLSVRKGEWIAILGESGCGKSTLLQVLQKFYASETGAVKANGIDLNLISYRSWRQCLGVVPQQIKLFNGTLLDNILLGAPVENPKKLEAFFQNYGFDPYFRSLPSGYATLIGEGGINLSGGQRQLVGLARALYCRPQLLLLDEPTAALDCETEEFILGLLRKFKKNAAIILVTHRIRAARQADRIFLIERGCISHKGKHHELLKSENKYSKAWYSLTGAS